MPNRFQSIFDVDVGCHLNNLYDSVYFLKNSKSDSLASFKVLLGDIQRLTLASDTAIYVLSEDSLFLPGNDQLLTHELTKLSTWLNKNGCSVNFCVFGSYIRSHLLPVLNAHCTQIGSTAIISTLTDGQFCYKVIYSHTVQGIITNTSYKLVPETSSFAQISDEDNSKHTAEATLHVDAEEIFSLKSLLRQDETAPAQFQLFESLEQLYQVASGNSGATVIIPCLSYDEIEPISRLSYQLRNAAGNGVKLIIREVNPCIRYSDERFLLNSGINLIIPAELSFSRLLSQITAIQNQYYSKSLPTRYEEISGLRPHFDIQGLIGIDHFTRHVKSLVSQQINLAVDFALIRLDLLPGMTAKECLSLCQLRRNGDLITPCQNAVYIFLSAVRVNDIPPALNTIFNMNIDILFKEQTFYFNSVDITEELEHAQQTAIPLTQEYLVSSEKPPPADQSAKQKHQPRSYAKRFPLQHQSEKVLT